jgi:hypothetical protein
MFASFSSSFLQQNLSIALDSSLLIIQTVQQPSINLSFTRTWSLGLPDGSTITLTDDEDQNIKSIADLILAKGVTEQIIQTRFSTNSPINASEFSAWLQGLPNTGGQEQQSFFVARFPAGAVNVVREETRQQTFRPLNQQQVSFVTTGQQVHQQSSSSGSKVI